MASGNTSPEFAFLESIPDAVITVDRDGSIVQANLLAERLFGYEQGMLIGLKIEMLLPEKYRKGHSRLVGEFFTEPAARPMGQGRELAGIRRNGQEFPVEIAIGPIDGGNFSVAVIRDITAIERTREELTKSQEEAAYRAEVILSTFDSLDGHVAVLSRDGKIIGINDAWREFADNNGGNGCSEIGIGANYLDVCQRAASRDAETALVGLGSVLDGSRATFEMEYACHSPSEERWFLMRANPVGQGGGGAVVVHIDMTEKIQSRMELEHALVEIRKLKDRVQRESLYLQTEIKSSHNFDEIIGNSVAMRATLEKIDQVAPTEATVLLLGETGTGKELLARAVHSRSKRKSRPLIKVDCTALPPGLIDSELFGHVKGAFTGAHESRQGRFELADEGTIFLDEIGELPLELQAKLLRVIQEGEFRRLGGKRVQHVNVRVIAATNRDLHQEMREGRFRSDLYYRLSTFPIEIPPLRDRREDIPLLTSFFVSERSKALGKDIASVPKAIMNALAAYDWPGNVRELQNVCEQAIIVSPGSEFVLPETFAGSKSPRSDARGSTLTDLKSIEREHILGVLAESGWKIKGEGNAADRLGLAPSTLRSRMKKLGIERPRP